MKVKSLLTVLVLVLAALALVSQDDLQRTYVGKSKCLPELILANETYGIRLDKSQNAYLAAYKLKGKDILTIVQVKDNGDHCGVIRDVIQSRDADNSFVWECSDPRIPSAVIVGTWPAEHPKVSGPALEAWSIDLTRLKFVPVQGARIRCTAGDYAGSDEGGDLASWAKKRAVRSSSPQSK